MPSYAEHLFTRTRAQSATLQPQKRLKAIITECSFPNKLQHIADLSGHLTPQTLTKELRKIKRDVPIYIYGRKPRFVRLMAGELAPIKDERLRLLTQGRTFNV